MTIESFFIGTRMSGKRYGPQSKDMQVSEFIALISPKNEPEKFVLPDFSGLARRIDAQIRNQFIQQKEDDYYRRYRQLSDRWYPVSYTHLTLPTIHGSCRSRWSPYH